MKLFTNAQKLNGFKAKTTMANHSFLHHTVREGTWHVGFTVYEKEKLMAKPKSYSYRIQIKILQ